MQLTLMIVDRVFLYMLSSPCAVRRFTLHATKLNVAQGKKPKQQRLFSSIVDGKQRRPSLKASSGCRRWKRQRR